MPFRPEAGETVARFLWRLRRSEGGITQSVGVDGLFETKDGAVMACEDR